MWKIWCKVGKFGQSLKSGNIWEYFKKYWNGKKSKNVKLWKNLVETGKIWKTWWTVEKICKSLKSGKICETGKSVKKWKNIETAKKGTLENCVKSWWKVGKSEKPGGKWKNFVKVWKVEKFVKMCETFENLSKNEKILKWQKRENWKILEKPVWKWQKSGKMFGRKWKNVKNLV